MGTTEVLSNDTPIIIPSAVDNSTSANGVQVLAIDAADFSLSLRLPFMSLLSGFPSLLYFVSTPEFPAGLHVSCLCISVPYVLQYLNGSSCIHCILGLIVLVLYLCLLALYLALISSLDLMHT